MMSKGRNLKNKHNNTAGFTLVEIVVVLLVVSFLAATSAGVFLTHQEKERLRVTKYRLGVIKEAMATFLESNNRYPCPSSFRLRPQDAGAGVNSTFGFEGNSSTAPNTSHSCLFVAPQLPIPGTLFAPRNGASGVHPVTGHSIGNTRIGALPVRTLNLPDEFAVDGWGGMFTYAVVVTLATAKPTGAVTGPASRTGYHHDGGNIRITDPAGRSLITPVDSAHYVILSHGADQMGARLLKGTSENDLVLPCNGALSGVQSENCNPSVGADNHFIFTTTFSDLGAGQFDDIGIYEVQRRADYILPRGTVMAFDLASCPEGWSAYMDETVQPGRFLLGVTDGDVTRQNMDQTVTDRAVSPSTPRTYNLGDLGEDGVENMPAFLALRYCVKL